MNSGPYFQPGYATSSGAITLANLSIWQQIAQGFAG